MATITDKVQGLGYEALDAIKGGDYKRAIVCAAGMDGFKGQPGALADLGEMVYVALTAAVTGEIRRLNSARQYGIIATLLDQFEVYCKSEGREFPELFAEVRGALNPQKRLK